MADKKKYVHKDGRTENIRRLDKHDWVFRGELGNLTGLFTYDHLGVQKMLKREIEKSEFTKVFSEDLGALLNLSEGQKTMLAIMLQDTTFAEVFDWNEKMRAYLSDKTGMEMITCENYFRSFSTSKFLVKKITFGKYHLNRDYVFHYQDIKDGDFANIVLGYEFKRDETVVIKEPRVTMEMVNAMIDLYKKQNPE